VWQYIYEQETENQRLDQLGLFGGDALSGSHSQASGFAGGYDRCTPFIGEPCSSLFKAPSAAIIAA
jgi:hypothetical protein